MPYTSRCGGRERFENTAVYVVLGVDLEGHRDVLGHWVGDGSESAISG